MFRALIGSTGSSAAKAILEAMMTNIMNTSNSGNVTMECIVTRKPFVDEKMKRDE